MKTQIAVVGGGYWGKNLIRVFFELGVLRSICDVNDVVEKTYRQKYPQVKLVKDFEVILSDDHIKAVVLATPAITHYEMAKLALEAGKDLFVEKPLAVTLDDGEKLASIAESRQRILMVGHILQYHPAVRELRQLVKCGELGKIQYFYSNRLNIGKIRTEENILWSFAPHDISVMLSLLGEMPIGVSCEGGAYLTHEVSDVTMSQFVFPGGVRAHIFVSWLHPFKEQRLVVVGSGKMAVFDDTAEQKLVLYPHKVEWIDRIPTAVKAEAEAVSLDAVEPLKEECRHFLNCLESREIPATDAQEGLRVLRILDACQESLRDNGKSVSLTTDKEAQKPFFVHKSAYVDDDAEIGDGTGIWHFSHVMKGARIGKRCILGQNVNVGNDAVIGNNVKIQNNVSIYTGVFIEDDVFLGPSCVLTNVANPRSQVNRHSLCEKTILKRGCTIGANATIVCGVTVGRYAFVAAGTVVTKDVPDYALMMGVPARQKGWMSRHGHRLDKPDAEGVMTCPESGLHYREISPAVLTCLDLSEETPLPSELSKGTKSYGEFRKRS